MRREIIGVRQWASALFTGLCVTVSGPPIDPAAQIDIPGLIMVDVDNQPNDRVEILLIDEGHGLDERSIRKYLPYALERAGA